ncbi:PBSX family phage terminase large subunit [Duodenibacillus massiliensis]|uniref:PBSX family phage terminase large subunit n=1 Tax=Duodenibacillus massiliensis TaxID=1852381 RepID=UPI003AB697C4
MVAAGRKIVLSEVVGKGYRDFWNSRTRYLVCKGSRGSKKSKTTALRLIVNLMSHPEANALVIRRYARSLRDSCFADLEWAIHRLGFDSDWRATVSPLEIVRISTGQKILFRGLDDGQKVTSVTVAQGVLCWVWCEEASQLESEAEFNKLDLSIRGQVPAGLWKEIVLTLNPWSETWWGKRRFFDKPNPEVTALTTTYLCNEFLDDKDWALFEDLRANFPRRYRIEGLGEWGIAEGLIYPDAKIVSFDREAMKSRRDLKAFYGVDFGFTDPTAFVGGFYDPASKTVFVAWEIYERGLTNQALAARIKDFGLRREKVTCDSAEPKSIEELRSAGINAVPAAKGQDSVRYGIQRLQGVHIVVHPDCLNVAHEIQNYAWAKDKDGRPTDKPEHDFSHSMDSLRYGVEPLLTGASSVWARKMF